MLRDDCEDAGRKGHVEEPVRGLLAPLEVLEVAVECQEGLVPVVLARDVGTDGAEVGELLLYLLRRRLDVRLDAAEVLLMVHPCTCIADNLDVLWQELVTVLSVARG